MNFDDLHRKLQAHFTDGLVVIAGSGLSAAVGLPTMGELAKHLIERMPSRLSADQEKQWENVSEHLEAGLDLETSLDKVDIDHNLEAELIQLSAELIGAKEQGVVGAVLNGSAELPLSKLFLYLLTTTKSLSIVTTNYDRLIEFSAEVAGIGVDTLFVGQNFGVLDPKISHETLGVAVHTSSRKNIKRVYREHIMVFKPHGSLDWFDYNGSPVRCGIPVNLPRLMITPGKTKYVKGYDQPFDMHREKANHAIDNAARFLVLGYGFNDRQLETHLGPQLKRGQPCLILTRSLTDRAKEVLRVSPTVIALTEERNDHQVGTRVYQNSGEDFVENVSLWKLPEFIKEVLA